MVESGIKMVGRLSPDETSAQFISSTERRHRQTCSSYQPPEPICTECLLQLVPQVSQTRVAPGLRRDYNKIRLTRRVTTDAAHDSPGK